MTFFESFASRTDRKHSLSALTKSLVKAAPLPAGVLCITLALSVWAQDRPTLSPANSAELQRLLQVQESATVVPFSNETPPRVPADAFDRLFMWNEIALDTTAIDHTPVQPGEHRKFGEQFGPGRASRAMAIVHIAMFEAVNAMLRRYESYTGLPQSKGGNAMLNYAIAQSAHDALVFLYPSQQERLDSILQLDASHIKGSVSQLDAGRSLGIAAAKSISDLRSGDGSEVPDPRVGGEYKLIGGTGYWSPDPVSGLTLYLGAYWGSVKPFTLRSGDQFRAPAPPALTDPAYTSAFDQVKRLGGDPRFGTPTDRTRGETLEGIFWSYDGTPGLCAPPRLYNQIARALVFEHGMNTLPEAARMLAMINTAMADAGIAAWETKWYYQYWRPVTAIRSLDQGGNSDVAPDPNWYPLGAQATNTHGPNFTPPFPAYVSGHATIGGALFQILRHYYPDKTSFVFISDEWNGLNKDVSGQTRPLRPLRFHSLTEAERQNAESRVYLGVHWQFDSDAGIVMGNQVADWVWGHAFRPIGEDEKH
ncbi:MAG: vanadium-dependent haloperoxidase [Silvibacterium sp.]|nr:vanadium-dependent haloperoxidase [Silvibacterium sp.]